MAVAGFFLEAWRDILFEGGGPPRVELGHLDKLHEMAKVAWEWPLEIRNGSASAAC